MEKYRKLMKSNKEGKIYETYIKPQRRKNKRYKQNKQ